jgi:very-short-patch-repair endonuclease
MDYQKTCLECGINLPYDVVKYSSENYGILLCINHQRWIQNMQNITTQETIRLYFALKHRGVPAEMEKYDGYKHIDIAISRSKVNIEVDGLHHNFNSKQALSDLKRTYHSFLKGYLTLRIPNSLVYNDYTLNETADYIVGFLNENNNRHLNPA